MILHLGNDYVVKADEILQILNCEDAYFQSGALRDLSVSNTVLPEVGEPKSAVIVQREGETILVYSCISSRTLLKRWKERGTHARTEL